MNDGFEASLQTDRGRTGTAVTVLESALEPLACMEREMMELHQNVELLLPPSRSRVIQFVSSRAGEGVSTVVREYAWMAAVRLGKSVLIIDANHTNNGQREFFNSDNRYGWDDAIREQAAFQTVASRIGKSRVFLSCASIRHNENPREYDPASVALFIRQVKGHFDLALMDSPSLATGVDTAAVTRCVDGVVLVIEAGRTRWPVLVRAKKKILNNGGKLLGTVFNKRRNYIPDVIYSRL